MNALALILAGLLLGIGLAIKGVVLLRHHRVPSGFAYLLVGLALSLLLSGALLGPVLTSRELSPRPRAPCQQNLHNIGVACMRYASDHSEALPTSFSELTNSLYDPNTFVCPHARHKPGALTYVDEWADYVLVTNNVPESRDSLDSTSWQVLAYCKPENHGRIGCNVLLVNCSTMWVTPDGYSNLSCDVKSHSRINTRKPQQGGGTVR